MKRGSRTLVLAAALLLQACGANGLVQREPVTTVRVVNTTSYPELPDIPMPMEPALIAWQYDVPRDMSRLEAKNSRECQSVPENARDDAFWTRCGLHPVVTNSNVLYGFDQDNWNIMLANFAKLREYVFQLRTRIDIANESRREWRRKAEEERLRAASAGAPAGAAPTAVAPAPAAAPPAVVPVSAVPVAAPDAGNPVK
jgi:hypothetical protein